MVKSLRHKVLDGLALMGEGHFISVGQIAAHEGVSKSPQLYALMYDLCLRGLLIRREIRHTNGHLMYTFERTSMPVTDLMYTNESVGE